MSLRFCLIALALIFVTTGCGGDDTSTPDGAVMDSGGGTPDGSGPDATTPDATAPDASAPDATAPDASAPDAAASGACTNAEDQAVSMSRDLAADAESCGRGCLGGRDCTINCMTDDPIGLTMECAVCFGDTSRCTSMNCLTDCIGGDMARCTMCRREAGCLESFEMCSGLPGE